MCYGSFSDRNFIIRDFKLYDPLNMLGREETIGRNYKSIIFGEKENEDSKLKRLLWDKGKGLET